MCITANITIPAPDKLNVIIYGIKRFGSGHTYKISSCSACKRISYLLKSCVDYQDIFG
jgi:hypothetical protein